MAKPRSTLGKFLYGLLTLYRGFRAVVLNIVFIFLLLVFVGSLIGQGPVMIKPGSALLINPAGTLVDQLTYVEPIDTLVADAMDQDIQTGEVLLQDLLDAIDYAAGDSDISSIVLVLDNLLPSGFSKLQDLAGALDNFRASGKQVYAYGDSYTQGQYYLAAHADEVILNTMGNISLEGFGTYQYYYKDALDKLGVNVHVFRVGEYKSAVEPYVRNDMSDQAREANEAWLGDLWQQYVSGVATARDLPPDFLQGFIDDLDQHLQEYDGDMGRLAMASNLVDSLMSRNETSEYLQQQIGTDGDDFLHVDVDTYLAAHRDQFNRRQESANKVGVIVASGTIYDGSRDPGEIGGDSLQYLIHLAGQDDDIKALVLRIDSGGGSAFASEVIRAELERFRSTGKPLVVSMGSVAASGGYWIATPADEIWASNSTITGSIGIFGLYPTFEDSFAKLGLHTDGVGTTDLAGALGIGRALPENAEAILQLMLEDGYNRFISLVAESRDLSAEEVDAIARGRVWSGEDAMALGLVDKMGSLDDAVDAAASMAGLDTYGVQVIEKPLSPGQQLLQDLAGNALVRSVLEGPARIGPVNVLSTFYRTVNTDIQALLKYNDPRGLYLQCQECLQALSP